MNEDDLRQVLGRRSGEPSASRDILHRAQLEAADRRRRRDTAYSALAGGVLSALAVAAILVPQMGNDTPANPAQPMQTQAEIALADSKVEASEPAAPSPVVNKRPKALVAASAAGRLVTIDSVSGKTTKALTTISDPDDSSKGMLLGGLALSPDAKTVYFDARNNDVCRPSIRSVAITGGAVSEVVGGSAPSLSTDGTRLAYVRHDSCQTVSIAIRNLRSGQEQVVPLPSIPVPVDDIASLSWSEDGARLIADVRSTDATANRLAIVEIASGTSKLLSPSADSKTGTTWEWPTFLPNGDIFVSERCCVAAQGEGSMDDSRLIVVNTSGKLQTVVANGVATKSHTKTATDGTGDHLLYMSGQDLMASDDRGRPAPLAYGLLGATWR